MALHLRPATPADRSVLVELICLADQAHRDVPGYSLALGPDPAYRQQVLGALVVTRMRHPFHYSHFLVAQAGSGVVAGLAGYDNREVDPADIEEGLAEIGWSAEQIARLQARISPVLPVARTLPEVGDAFVLEHVATLPAWRRQGIMGTLLAAMLDRARAGGLHTCVLDVYLGNDAARRLYERVGFRVIAERTDPQFARVMGCPGIARLVRVEAAAGCDR